MAKYFLILILFLVGCEGKRDSVNRSKQYSTICIDGHTYYKSHGYQLAIKLTPQGRPVPCD